MPSGVRSGYQSRPKRRDIGAELRLLEARDEIKDLKRVLIRLRSAAIEHLERPSPATLARLRFELGRQMRAVAA
jgi:hypothetical protein